MSLGLGAPATPFDERLVAISPRSSCSTLAESSRVESSLGGKELLPPKREKCQRDNELGGAARNRSPLRDASSFLARRAAHLGATLIHLMCSVRVRRVVVELGRRDETRLSRSCILHPKSACVRLCARRRETSRNSKSNTLVCRHILFVSVYCRFFATYPSYFIVEPEKKRLRR